MTGVSKEATLEHVLCIYYLVQLQKNKISNVQVLIDLESEVNAMSPAYVKKFCFRIRKTDVDAQKIDGSILETFEIVITFF